MIRYQLFPASVFKWTVWDWVVAGSGSIILCNQKLYDRLVEEIDSTIDDTDKQSTKISDPSFGEFRSKKFGFEGCVYLTLSGTIIVRPPFRSLPLTNQINDTFETTILNRICCLVLCFLFLIIVLRYSLANTVPRKYRLVLYQAN